MHKTALIYSNRKKPFNRSLAAEIISAYLTTEHHFSFQFIDARKNKWFANKLIGRYEDSGWADVEIKTTISDYEIRHDLSSDKPIKSDLIKILNDSFFEAPICYEIETEKGQTTQTKK